MLWSLPRQAGTTTPQFLGWLKPQESPHSQIRSRAKFADSSMQTAMYIACGHSPPALCPVTLCTRGRSTTKPLTITEMLVVSSLIPELSLLFQHLK